MTVTQRPAPFGVRNETKRMTLTGQQLAYLRRLYKACGPKPGACAASRAVARAIGATEDERIDIEDALAQRGYI
jgi:hypothetical protein